MTRRLTITIDDEVYEGLYRRVGRRHISRFLESLARPHVVSESLEDAYRAMAADEVRESEAREWSENLACDVAGETR
jgi:predicted CopG family antitoxin